MSRENIRGTRSQPLVSPDFLVFVGTFNRISDLKRSTSVLENHRGPGKKAFQEHSPRIKGSNQDASFISPSFAFRPLCCFFSPFKPPPASSSALLSSKTQSPLWTCALQPARIQWTCDLYGPTVSEVGNRALSKRAYHRPRLHGYFPLFSLTTLLFRRLIHLAVLVETR